MIDIKHGGPAVAALTGFPGRRWFPAIIGALLLHACTPTPPIPGSREVHDVPLIDRLVVGERVEVRYQQFGCYGSSIWLVRFTPSRKGGIQVDCEQQDRAHPRGPGPLGSPGPCSAVIPRSEASGLERMLKRNVAAEEAQLRSGSFTISTYLESVTVTRHRGDRMLASESFTDQSGRGDFAALGRLVARTCGRSRN